MKKTKLMFLLIPLLIFVLANLVQAESTGYISITDFNPTLHSSISTTDSENEKSLFQLEMPVEDESSNEENMKDQTKTQTTKSTAKKNNAPSRTVMRNNKLVQVHDEPWTHQSFFMLGMDLTWGFDFSEEMNSFYAFNYILEFSTPNIFDSNIFKGLAMQLGVGFGKGEYTKTTLTDEEVDGESKILTFVMGIKYSVKVGDDVYISTGLRFFVVSYEEDDENVGIELYLDIRFPFHENFMLILHLGPQIPSGFESEFTITNGLSLVLHF